MKYVTRVMTMGDMSPAGLSHAYYNSPDGEPEDIVVATLGVYDTEDEARANADADYATYEKEYDGEEGGCWIECIVLQDKDYLDYMGETDALEFLSSDELYELCTQTSGALK